MKKEIGILTLYKDNMNYGGMLQAYALQHCVVKIIGQNGRCVQISYTLSKTPLAEKIKHSLQYRSFKENFFLLFLNIKRICFNKYKKKKTRESLEKRRKNFLDFEHEIPHTLRCYNYKTISECSENFTHLITGSDQVWNGGIDLTTFCLNFAKNDTIKISYAASSMSTKFGQWQGDIFKKNLHTFTALSVREKSVIPYFEHLSGKEVKQVIDPVFLLSAEEWRNIAILPSINQPYIFCYLLGENLKYYRYAEKLAKMNNCKLVTIPYLHGYNRVDLKFGDMQIWNAGPKEFVGLVEGAKAVITDSFHGTVFSVIFEKTFWVLPRFKNTVENHRVTDILSNFDLSDRYMCEDEKLCDLEYVQVQSILKKQREESYHFLENALEAGK